jgi:hypothetical protein
MMTICSIKRFEIPSLCKHKARIVYRGDLTKDHTGAMAVFQELSANPTSLSSARCTIAFGCIPGNKITQSDAVRAYVQSLLLS